MKKQINIEFITQIDQYIKGNLSQADIDELWKKFLRNPEYFHLFEAELHLRNLIKKGEKPDFINFTKESKIIEVSGIRSWLYATAAAIFIVIGFQFFSISETDSLNIITLSSIDISEMAGIDVYRSDEEVLDELDLAINDALVTTYMEDSSLAISHYRQLLDQPLSAYQNLKVEMNLGILLYNTGNYDEAAYFFNSVSTNTSTDVHDQEKSLWFLANSYLQLGDLENGRKSLLQVHSLSGRFQQPALTLIRKIDIQIVYNSDD